MGKIRILYLTIKSAQRLDNIRHIGEMKVYAKVSLNGEKHTKKKTNVDSRGGVNPKWNFTVKYSISELAFSGEQQQPLEVAVKLYCARTRGKKFLGQVEISAQNLFNSWVGGDGEQEFTVAGTRDGSLNISFNFGEPYLFVEPDQAQQPANNWGFNIRQMVLRFGIWFCLSSDLDVINPF